MYIAKYKKSCKTAQGYPACYYKFCVGHMEIEDSAQYLLISWVQSDTKLSL